MSENVITPEFRASYVHAFTPQTPMKSTDTPKYSVTMLFPLDADLSALKAEAKRAATEAWGADESKWPVNWRNPFRDQGEKPDSAGYVRGAKFISARSTEKPGLIDARRQPIIDESEFYSGCYARASVRAFAYGGKGTTFAPGISFGLQNIQMTREGERLGSARTKPEDDFEAVEGAGEMASETAPAGAGGLFD